MVEIHGKSNTRTYRAWIEMKARTGGKDESSREHYRDRGISVCFKWKSSFVEFLNDMGECQPGMTLDRINNNGDYRPGNCRWVPQSQQLRNTRRTIRVVISGEEMCLKDACALVNVNYECVLSRIRSGIDPQRALYEGRPVGHHAVGNKNRLGAIIPDEMRSRISISLKGRSRSPEAISKHRATMAAKRAALT